MSTQQWRNWADRRTEDHFARQINQVNDLRPDLREGLEQGLLPGEQPRSMIFAPYQAMLKRAEDHKHFSLRNLSWKLSPDWLLVLTQNRLLLFSIPVGGAQPHLIPIDLDAILYLKQGTILLYSWLTLVWVEQGAICQETILYNTVCQSYFSELLTLIRERMRCNPAASGEDLSRQVLDGLPFKFKNLIRLYMLLPGESVRQVIYRPAVWKKMLLLFRKMSMPRFVLALTDDHILLVEEDMPVVASDNTQAEGSYGIIVTYLPVSRVHHTAIQPVENGLEWVITLERQGALQELKVNFPREAEAALNELACRLKP